MEYNNFITLEGGEGSGKSTLGKLLKKELEDKGCSVLLTREPGGDKISEKIRDIIMSYEIHPKTEAHLFAAARIEHINNVILPALKKGMVVICDRYVDSSIVYQKYAGSVDNVEEINEYAYKNCMPSKTFFLKISPEDALKRIVNTDREINRFDEKDIEFHNKVYNSYLDLSKKESRFFEIDANHTSEEILKDVMSNLENLC